MASYLEFGFRATAIGSLPHTDAAEACRLVRGLLPDIPAWPQLLRRTYLENMSAQYSEGFPGLRIEKEHIVIDQSGRFDEQLEKLHEDHAARDFRDYAIGPDYAAGLHAFASSGGDLAVAKGQVAGPVSWGLSISGEKDVPILYDDLLAEALVKHLALKAAWQEWFLGRVAKTTIIFLDEPYLSSLGTAFVSLSPEQAAACLQQVLHGIKGLKGVHCCGGADWTLLLNTSLDILSFDAYTYADSLALYPQQVKALLKRGGAVAWGIVPTNEDVLAGETVAGLRDRLGEALAPFTREGLPIRDLVAGGLLTPSCGLASLSPEAAERALELLAGVSDAFRRRYG